jgi:hypothetical protein
MRVRRQLFSLKTFSFFFVLLLLFLISHKPAPTIHHLSYNKYSLHKCSLSIFLFCCSHGTALAPATVVAPHYHLILFPLNWLSSSLLRPGADGSHHLTLFFAFGMDRPCARRQLVCEYPAESYRGRRASGPKAAPPSVRPQQR